VTRKHKPQPGYAVSDHIRAAMQTKYPYADFAPYFAYLEARPVRRWRHNAGLHRHHIAPREQFPELDGGYTGPNIIVLRVSEHKRAHCILAQAVPEANWPAPKFVAAAAKGGRKLAALGLGIHAPGVAEKGRRIGGRIAGRKAAALGLGIHAPGVAEKGRRLRPQRIKKAVALYKRGLHNLHDIAEAVFKNRARARTIAGMLRAAGVLK
jgi:hypothetical protein